MENMRKFISFWNEIHTIIDEAMEKRDRTVSVYFHPENGLSVNIYPWPDVDELYDQYKKGEISKNDFRERMGLPRLEETVILNDDMAVEE